MKYIVLATFAFLFLFSCKPNRIEEQMGRMRLVNASSIAGDINMKVDGQYIYATNVQYLNYSLFRNFIVAKRELQIVDASGNVLIDTAISIENNKVYSVFMYDSMNVVLYRLVEEDFTPVNGSFCKMRFLNFNKDGLKVDVYKHDDTNFNFKNVANGQYSAFTKMQAGETQFDVYVAGTNIFLYNYYGYNYKSGGFYTVYLKGAMSSQNIDSLGIFTIENHLNY